MKISIVGVRRLGGRTLCPCPHDRAVWGPKRSGLFAGDGIERRRAAGPLDARPVGHCLFGHLHGRDLGGWIWRAACARPTRNAPWFLPPPARITRSWGTICRSRTIWSSPSGRTRWTTRSRGSWKNTPGRLRTLRLYANWEEFEVRLKDIAYIEIQGHTAFGAHRRPGDLHPPGIDSLEEELTLDSFFRCHRSYLVNLDHVTGLEKRDFLMDDGTKVPISSQTCQSPPAFFGLDPAKKLGALRKKAACFANFSPSLGRPCFAQTKRRSSPTPHDLVSLDRVGWANSCPEGLF